LGVGEKEVALGAEPDVNWGRNMRKKAAPLIVQASARPQDGWEDDEQAAVEMFPALGGGSTTSPARQNGANAGGSFAAKAGGSFAPAVAAKPKPKPKPPGPDFPSLGSAKNATSSASDGGWAAQARERAAVAAKVAAEPPKPKLPPKPFEVVVEMFPDLPMGGPKPLSVAAKAGAKAAKAKAAKAKAVEEEGAAARASRSSAAIIEPEVEEEQVVQIVPDDQLILIHDPLDAVAKTEAENAERRANKVKKPRKGLAAAPVNPWIAGSSPTYRVNSGNRSFGT